MQRRFSFPISGTATVLGLTALVVLLCFWLLQPPSQDLLLLGLFLLLSGGLTLTIGHLVTRFGLGTYIRRVRGKLLFVLSLSAALALINVGFTSYLMFISQHDLVILSLLLLFSLGMSLFLALTLSESLHQTMQEVLRGVRQMSTGEFRARIQINSGDEWQEVAHAFNAMALQLEAASVREKELEQARRQLVAAVSRDLRTPLASMRAMVESINDGVVTDAETLRRYMQTLQSEVEYLSRLIDDLFELSQIDSGLLELRLEQADLHDLVTDTLEGLFAQALQRRLNLHGEVDHGVPSLVMDTKRIQRVLYNLLQNAMRHTPADGTILIRAEEIGGEVHVSVVDSGEGIAASELPRLFERFHRRDQARSRTQGGGGLGLSIAKGIVEAHGGRIWAESTPGQGATFTFVLPKTDAAQLA